jgi:putative transposase
METQKVTTEFRMSQWTKIIQSRIDSGLSIKDFCQANGISRHAYFYWQKKLRERACTAIEAAEETRSRVPGGWMQLAPKREYAVKETLGIEINGCNITVDAETDLELLKKVCRVLMSL